MDEDNQLKKSLPLEPKPSYKSDRVLAAFLPGPIGGILMLVDVFNYEMRLSANCFWIGLIASACYLFSLTLAWGKRDKRRGFDLFSHSFMTALVYLAANGFIAFAVSILPLLAVTIAADLMNRWK